MLPAPLRVMLALPKRMFFARTSMAALSPSSAATANVPATSTASGARKRSVSSMVRSPVAVRRSVPSLPMR